ncbi:unnamed protein product [Owenia fusiformis]|uniref:ditrans,polycis-polyprenyl diphosphate synthase [(2E,6E)-farnesyldiphosphate specific] n=1 Tax=Owenia fusiformis TaxID=6347 RepID=A0A8J1XIC8_OWEFU|nr:unnamed protein product [Owenia fusiformis]
MVLYGLILRMLHFLGLLRTCMHKLNKVLLSPGLIKNTKTTSQKFKEDVSGLKKRPLHLGLLIYEHEVSFSDVANIIVWAMAMGVNHITVCDRHGNFKRNEENLRKEIKRSNKEHLGYDYKNYNAHIHSHNTKPQDIGYQPNSTHIQLHSIYDGRNKIVTTARKLCQGVATKTYKKEDIVPHNIDAILQDESGFPDPDLVLRFGETESMLGFMPWQLRLTEILSISSHHKFSYTSFLLALQSYGNIEQRFGK